MNARIIDITPKAKPDYSRYIELSEMIKALEQEKKVQGEIILHAMKEAGEKSRIEMDFNFTVSQRKSWEYPAEIIKQEEELKAQKKTAERIGTAKATVSEFITAKAANKKAVSTGMDTAQNQGIALPF